VRMVETKLTVKDFAKFFERNDLGKLSFPNGKIFVPRGAYLEWGRFIPFFIDLNDLYKTAVGWRINSREVEVDDIIAIVAFGSAVKHPGYDEHISQYKKYLFFGPMKTKVKHEPVQPRDADFLVITHTNLFRREIIKSVVRDVYGGTEVVTKGGIHLVNRSRINIIRGTRAGDTVSSSALEQGVPVFTTSAFWKLLREDAGITQKNPRRVCWDTDERGILHGEIR